MPTIRVLVEVDFERSQTEAFTLFEEATKSADVSTMLCEAKLEALSSFGLEVSPGALPIPMFGARCDTTSDHQNDCLYLNLQAFRQGQWRATSMVVACEMPAARLAELQQTSGVKVWPNSTLSLFNDPPHLFDGAFAASRHVDCLPHRPPATLSDIRRLLGVERIWDEGFRGQNVVVGILDDGINNYYPVIGGYERQGGPRPGAASLGSHGSMCAGDVLVASPFVRFLDYPLLAGRNGGTSDIGLAMFQAILNQRSANGTPHLTSNSYGFTSLPERSAAPNHEAYDRQHPLNRKVREVIASGCPCFFAAGNCGSPCPAGVCATSAIGPGLSISGPNSLAECITIAAVNSRHERLGYSAQGPGILCDSKPDFAAYSHFYGHFGPGRPAGGPNFDSGTSAACPVAVGVAALLLSAFGGRGELSPSDLREVFRHTAINLNQPGWDAETGYGIINAGAAFAYLRRPFPGDLFMPMEPG